MRMRLALVGCLCASFAFAGEMGESADTETTAEQWNRAAALSADNPHEGAHCVRSGVINGNYPSFTLTFAPRDLRGAGPITLWVRAETDAAAWKPEVRLSDGGAGFLYYHTPGAVAAGNLGWTKISFDPAILPVRGEVDLGAVTQLSVVGFQAIAPPGGTLRMEFFVDGLRLAGKEAPPPYAATATGESVDTETTAAHWNREAALSDDNPHEGAHCVRSGPIRANHPSFTLTFAPRDMRAGGALSLWLRVRTDATDWKPEVRLSDGGAGFLYYHAPGDTFAGDLGWTKIELDPAALRAHGEVDRKNITTLSVVGYRAIAPAGQTLTTEFFVDSLRLAGKETQAAAIAVERPYAFRRMAGVVEVPVTVENNLAAPLEGATLVVETQGGARRIPLAALPAGEAARLVFPFDTALRPDAYPCAFSIEDAGGAVVARDEATLHIVARPPPHRLPLIHWGDAPNAQIQPLGFTHNFIHILDNPKVWEAGEITASSQPDAFRRHAATLDQALLDGFGAAAYLCPARYLMPHRPEMMRVDREGKPYEGHQNLCATNPDARAFAYRAAASAAQTYARFPAIDIAMGESEVRDGANFCFHPRDLDDCRRVTGRDFPAGVKSKNGVSWRDLPNFPASRVIADDHPLLAFYTWYWKNGDGWNGFLGEVARGFQTGGRAIPVWYDPAVRVPSLGGAGGAVDLISQWSYSTPDPVKVGKAADELFAMASLSERPAQQVTKTIQAIWYRSWTAPKPAADAATEPATEWEREFAEANFITIAPDHLREAFWCVIARDVKAVMFHNAWVLDGAINAGNKWQYRCTNDTSREVLAELAKNVLLPLGPALVQVPEAESDVLFLQSFASEMFAGVGDYGWGSTWINDAYQVLNYAGLQPRVIYDEHVRRGALDGAKMLVAVDCPVLTESVAARIKAFQRAGGVLIADEKLAPALTADILVASHRRSRKADRDKAALMDRAVKLARELVGVYAPRARVDNPEIVLRLRGGSDDGNGGGEYLFAANDHRAFGDYVGHHGLVMEKGLPSAGRVGFDGARRVYDLVAGREVEATVEKGKTSFALSLPGGGGGVFLLTDRPIERLAVEGPGEAARGAAIEVRVRVADGAGRAVAGVVPVAVEVFDAEGRPAEGTGHYGAVGGELTLALQPAANDTPGAWRVRARELASGKEGETSFFVR